MGEKRSDAASSLRKHLAAVGINTWKDVNQASLYDLADEVKETMAGGSPHTFFTNVKTLFRRYSDQIKLPEGWEGILSAKNERPVRTFLTARELAAFEAVPAKRPRERIVQVESLIEAYTGARISDVMRLTAANYTENDYLSYTSKKTKVGACIPISEKTKGWIEYAQTHRDDEPTLMSRNRIIRRLAQRAGIRSKVKVVKGGQELEGEKWQFLSSHSFRISAATNMSLAGASLLEIKAVLGHTNTAMTERYVVAAKPQLSQSVMAYFLK